MLDKFMNEFNITIVILDNLTGELAWTFKQHIKKT